MAEISILMCTYNGAQYIGDQLQSLSEQTHQNWSLRVQDDGSTDATPQKIKAYAATIPQSVTVSKGPGQGFAANFITGLCAPGFAPGWVALSDQDDVWYPDKLARAYRLLADRPTDRPALACARTLLTDAEGSPLGPSRRHRHFRFENALVQNVVAGNTILLNPAAHALLRAAGPVPVPYHDWWCYLLVTAAGGQVLYDPEPCMGYRQHGQNVLGENRSTKAVLRRAGSFAGGRWRGWFEANMAALIRCRDLLTPEIQTRLDAYRAEDLTSPRGLARGLHRLGAHRQRRYETAALYAGIRSGLT